MQMQDLQNLFANADPSTQFFDSKSIFALLGVEDIPQSEKDQMLKDFVTEAVNRAISRVLADPAVDEEVKAQIQQVVDSTPNIFKVQEELNSLLPENFVQYVVDESRLLKLEMSLNNIRETFASVKDNLDESAQKDFEEIVSLAEESFNQGDLDKYKEAYERYDALRKTL